MLVCFHYTIVLFFVILYSCRVEALLQPRANFEFLAKYFQGAHFLSLNQSMYCYMFDWYLDYLLFVSVLERGDGNYGLGFMGRPGPPGPKGMSPLQLWLRVWKVIHNFFGFMLPRSFIVQTPSPIFHLVTEKKISKSIMTLRQECSWALRWLPVFVTFIPSLDVFFFLCDWPECLL